MGERRKYKYMDGRASLIGRYSVVYRWLVLCCDAVLAFAGETSVFTVYPYTNSRCARVNIMDQIDKWKKCIRQSEFSAGNSNVFG